MPRSSGGGSSHGGSHHSSSSSRSSSRSSSSSSSSAPARRVSTSYFRGSRVYVRYNGMRPEYRYANEPLDQGISKYIGVIILIVFLILNGLPNLFDAFYFANPLSGFGVTYTEPEIFDAHNILGDTTRLEQSMEDFKDKTGIIPVVVTLYNDEWRGQGYDLEQYAYNWYVYHFEDEKHWVIMYSEEPNSNDTFGDWYWEGMQGDDTIYIITDYRADTFTDSLQKNFIAGGRYTKADAIAQAFDDLNDGSLVGLRFDVISFAAAVFKLGIATSLIIWLVIKRKKDKKEIEGFKEVKGAQIVNNMPLEDTCKYCECVYVVGTISVCPHCGAPIPAHNPINK